MSVMELTRQCLGDHAQHALDNGAIIPVKADKTPMVRGWKDPIDPKNIRSYVGLAVKTGLPGGITVIDYDSSLPAASNVRTSRGGHVWVAAAPTDSNSANGKTHIDVRGNGGYAVFYSPNHQVLHTSLASRDDYLDYLHVSKSKISNLSNRSMYDNGVHFAPVPTNEYLQEVKGYGYNIDVEWTSKRLASQVAGTPEGSRNTRLYVNLTQVIHLGGTEEQVKRVLDAGFEIGLDGEEVMRTLNSARAAKQVIPVLHIVSKWADKAREVVKSTIPDELVRLATEQHNMVPLVSKKGLSTDAGIPLSTVKRHLSKLEEAGLVEENVNPGWRLVNGRKMSNASNYRLMIGEGK